MDDVDQDIMQLFEDELRNLDAHSEESDDDEFGLRELESMGERLRQSLTFQTAVDTNEEEWSSLLTSTRNESERLQDVQQSVSTISLLGQIEETQDTNAFAPHNGRNRELLLHIPAPGTIPVDPVVLDLMDSMLSGVEKVSSLSFLRPALAMSDRSKVFVADFSALPQLLGADIDVQSASAASPRDMSRNGYTSNAQHYAGYANTLVEQRRQQMQEALEFVAQAEQRLRAEEAEAKAALEVDRQQRLLRKQRMVEEMLRAKRKKAATRIQSCIRRKVAQDARVRLTTERAERLRLQQEQDFLQAERLRESQEQARMRDSDLETMQAIHAEVRRLEREVARMQEEEHGAQEMRRSESQVLKWSMELKRQEDKQLVLDLICDTLVPAVMSRIEMQEEMRKKEMESIVADNVRVWGHFNASKGPSTQTQSAVDNASTQPDGSLRHSASQSIVIDEMNRCWGYFSKLHLIDRDYGETGVFTFDVKALLDGSSDKHKEQSSSAENNLFNFAAEQRSVIYPERVRDELYKTDVITDSMKIYWSDLAKSTVSRAVSEVSFSSANPDVSFMILQKRIPLAFVGHQAERLPEQALQPSSPRAKVGMRVVSARGVATSNTDHRKLSYGTTLLIPSEPLAAPAPLGSFVEPSVSQNHSQVKSGCCPVVAALQCWQRSKLGKAEALHAPDLLSSNSHLNKSRANRVPPHDARVPSAGMGEIMQLVGFDSNDLNLPDYEKLPESSDQRSRNSHENIEDSEEEEEEESVTDRTPASDCEVQNDILEQLGLRGDPSNISNLELGVEGLRSSSFLNRFVNLKKLLLNVNKLSALDGLDTLQQLEDLQVKDNSLVDIRALNKCKALKSLYLDTNQLTNISALKGLQELVTLSVNTNKLVSLQRLSRCHKLQKLQLYHNQITEISVKSLKCLHSLTHLDLGRNKLERVSGEALSQCPLLQTLVLSQNKMLSVPAPLRLPQLKTLWLSGNLLENLSEWCPKELTPHSVDTPAAKNLHSFDWPLFCPMLEKLHLQDNRLQCLNSTALLVFPHLTLIDISFNGIASVENIQGISVCPRLSALQIQENPISTSAAMSETMFQWILESCPRIQSISGEDISEKRARSHSELLSKAVTVSILSNKDASSHVCDPMMHKINCCIDKVIRESLGLHLPREAGDTRWSTDLLQLLESIVVKQNVFRVNDKVQRRLQEKANSLHNSASANNSNSGTARSLDDQYIDLLNKHQRMLDKWSPQVSASAPPSLVKFQSMDTMRRNVNEKVTKLLTIRGKRHGLNRYQLRCLAASKMQALARGHRVRKHLKKALAQAKYEDAEIDDIFIGDVDFNLDDLNDAPELHVDYFRHPSAQDHDEALGHFAGPGKEIEYDAQQEVLQVQTSMAQSGHGRKPMVYGDHRRRAQSNKPALSNAFPQDSMASPDIRTQSDRGKLQITSWMDEGQILPPLSRTQPSHLGAADTFVSPFGASPRPSSALTDSSEISADSGHRAPPAYEDELPDMYPGYHAGATYKETNSERLRIAANRNSQNTSDSHLIAQEWGISDPKVLAMMVKRSKSIKSGASSAGSGSTKRVMGVSGSFGGKPKIIRGTNKTQGRKGVTPAWAKPPTEEA